MAMVPDRAWVKPENPALPPGTGPAPSGYQLRSHESATPAGTPSQPRISTPGQAAPSVPGIKEPLKTHIRYKFKFKLQTKEQLEANSPSRRDGLDPEKENRWRRQYTMLIHELGQKLAIPMWGIAAAVLLCHRFFAAKSMLKNDRFVVAIACLFLASKVEESPKHIRKVVEESERHIWGRKLTAQQLTKQLEDKVLMEERKEEILMAERAILYTLGFQLNIQHPYKFLLEKLRDLSLLNLTNDSPYKRLMQDTWNMINDSLRTTLCMQYRPEHLAYSALYLAAHVNLVEVPLQGQTFWSYFNIGLSDLRGIANQILELYEVAKAPELAMLPPAPAAVGGPPPAVPSGTPHIYGGQLKYEGTCASLVIDSDRPLPTTTALNSACTSGPPLVSVVNDVDTRTTALLQPAKAGNDTSALYDGVAINGDGGDKGLSQGGHADSSSPAAFIKTEGARANVYKREGEVDAATRPVKSPRLT